MPFRLPEEEVRDRMMAHVVNILVLVWGAAYWARTAASFPADYFVDAAMDFGKGEHHPFFLPDKERDRKFGTVAGNYYSHAIARQRSHDRLIANIFQFRLSFLALGALPAEEVALTRQRIAESHARALAGQHGQDAVLHRDSTRRLLDAARGREVQVDASAIPRILGASDVDIPSAGLGFGGVCDRGPIGKAAYGMCDSEYVEIFESSRNFLSTAIGTGLRLLDSAWLYGSDPVIGRMLAASKVPRRNFFVMTKIMPDNFLPAATRADNGSETAARAEGDESPMDYFGKQLAELRTGYVDVLFTHHVTRDDYFQQTWKKMEQVQLDGKARFLGVSGVKDLHLARDCMASGICRAQSRIFMQVPWTPCASGTWPEGWPYLNMTELTNVVLINHDIATCRAEPVVNALARHHRTTFYTIVLSWARQFNITSLFAAYALDHLQADLETRVGLSQEEMAVLYGLQAVYAHSPDLSSGPDANCAAVHLGSLVHDPLGIRLLYANLSDVAGSNCAMRMASPEDDLGAEPKGRMVRLEVLNNGDTDVEIVEHLRGGSQEREAVIPPHSSVRDEEVEDGEVFDVVARKGGYQQEVQVDADRGLEQRIVIPPRIIRRHG